jgi:hypothetical protein
MAGYQIETGTAHGRGFAGTDATGIMAKFYAWVTKAYASGGPLWYILDDFSANAPVTCAYTDVTVATHNFYIPAHGFSNGHAVRISTSGSLPGGLSSSSTYYVIRVDADNFKLATYTADAYTGTVLSFTTQGSGNHTFTPYEFFIIISDTAVPTVNDYNSGPGGNAPKFLKIGYMVAEAAYIRMSGYLWWNTTTHKGQGLFGAYRVATYDAADFAYDFRGGAEQMNISARLGTAWSFARIDDFTGDTNFLEVATKIGVLQSGVTAGSSVILQLDTGQASNFTLNNYYYIFDFSTATWVNYVKVTNVNTGVDQITVNTLSQNFTSGSVVSPYAHRYYLQGSGDYQYADDNQLSYFGMNYYYYCIIPYYSSLDNAHVIHIPGGYANSQGNIITGANLSYMATLLNQLAPDDLGYYACQKPSISEYRTPNYNSNSTSGLISMNRCYGVAKNIYVTMAGTMAVMLDYRTIAGADWLYLISGGGLPTSGTAAYLFLNTAATS